MADKSQANLLDELPISPMSQGSMAVNRTGSWKYLEPYFEDQTPPCVDRCPVQNDISMLMRFVENGDHEGAAKYILEHNPFPATLGRICPHPCEEPCNRKAMGGAVRIQAVERFIGDYALEHRILPDVPQAGKPIIAVVGAGPAGLSAAYFLRLPGHAVTVFEKSDCIGGALRRETPTFRISREVLSQELGRFEELGIQFELNQTLGRDFTLKELRRKFAAVILAIGQSRSRELGLPGDDHPAVFDAVKLLEANHRGETAEMGNRVLVVGGTRTAVDCARTLIRTGRDVKIVYLRSRKEMPAFKQAVTEATEEGVELELLIQPNRLIFQNDELVGVECVRMELGEPDPSRRRRVEPVEGSEFIVPADAVVTALGKELDVNDLGDSVEINGGIEVDFQFHTSLPGVYACGECVSSAATVADAVRAGRQAAHEADSGLKEGSYQPANPLKRRGASSEIAKFKNFNRAYHQTESPVPQKVREPAERIKDREEYVLSLKEGEVRREASRCFKCGTCVLCDNCYLFCPDAAISRRADGTGYDILDDYCKGCGVCVEECPRGGIHLRQVQCFTPDPDTVGDES